MDNVILIGMPGCGKSTVGVLLAKRLGYSFIDTDLLIQQSEGKRLFEISDVTYIDGLSADGRRKALTLAGEQLGIALGNFCNMVSLDEIIICGEITKYEDVIIPSIEKSYNDTVIKQAAAKISAKNIRNAAFGAARLAIEAYPYILKRKNV